MEKYIFRFNPALETGYIESEKTKTKAGIFYSQLEGLELIDDMVEDKAIEIVNSIALIHDIVNSEMVLYIKDDEFVDTLAYNFIMASYMLSIREKIQKMILSDKILDNETRLHVCGHCGYHGYIIYNGIISEEIISKDQALFMVETISFKEIISYLEKEKLIQEIEESSLPNISPAAIARLN